LAALAYAVQEPITALLSGRSVWGNTEVIDVSIEVCGSERSGDTIFLEDDRRYQIRVPVIFPDVTKFAASIVDTSTDEKWGQGSLLVCADLNWKSDFNKLKRQDFIIVVEKRENFVNGVVLKSMRCTVRELTHEEDADYLVSRSRSPRFRDSIRLPFPIIDMDADTEEPITTGLGTQILLIGKVLASYTVEDAAKVLQETSGT
jgi:hypothetical protein